MKIAINSSPLSTGHAGRGVGVYTRCLVDALRHYEPDHTYVLFAGNEPVPQSVDVVHYPFFDPFFVTLPFRSPVPFVVTVHDLTPIALPDLFPPGVRGRLKWEIQKRLLMNASRIITDSECSRSDVVRFTGFPRERIDPVYLAPSDAFAAVPENVPKPENLPDGYFLYVGDVNRNKNILGLLQGFRAFIADGNVETIFLVLVGKSFLNPDLAECREIDGEIKKLGLEKKVIRPGFVSDADLVRMYAHAVATVQPSLYEGFGLPVLEAMACGGLVMVSDVASLSEIAGPSWKTKPDPGSLARAFAHMVSLSGTERAVLVKAGRKWTHEFSWEKAAHETVQSYRRTVERI